MPDELVQYITHYAHQARQSRASFIREACIHYLKLLRERELEAAYIKGYQEHPEKIEEVETFLPLIAATLPEEAWEDVSG
jgi:metal-responsive CopG/Arc/MetJ family transcriptional regulator